MLVHFSVPLLPVKKLALSDADPLNNLLGRCFSPLEPVVGVINDGVTGVVGQYSLKLATSG